MSTVLQSTVYSVAVLIISAPNKLSESAATTVILLHLHVVPYYFRTYWSPVGVLHC
jgi:hypothetical protein